MTISDELVKYSGLKQLPPLPETPFWTSSTRRAMGNQTPVLHCRTPERVNGCDIAATRSKGQDGGWSWGAWMCSAG